MTVMWMVHVVIINEIWHSGLLLLICNKKTFMGQNKSTVLILHPVLGYLGRSGLLSPVTESPPHSCQLIFWPFVSCQLTSSRPSFIVQELFPKPSGQVFHPRRYWTRLTDCGFLSGQHTERFDRPGSDESLWRKAKAGNVSF